MPYIKKDQREEVNCYLEQVIGYLKDTAQIGCLNYIITKICIQFLKTKGESYATYNDLIGVLECAKLELYRRQVSKYENKKIKENSDVF